MTTNEESGIYSPLHNEPVYKPPMKKKKLKKKRVKKHVKDKSHKESKEESHKESSHKESSQKTRRKGKKKSKKTKRVGGGIVGSVSKSVKKSVGKAYDATKHVVKKKFRSKNTVNIYDKNAFVQDKIKYIQTLFINLRYGVPVDKKDMKSFLERRGINYDKTAYSKSLRDALNDLHDSIGAAVDVSGLSTSNKVSYKNCLCIAVADSLRYITTEDLKADALARIIGALSRFVLNSKHFTDEQSFENIFRVKFEKYGKLNFRLMNMYDYGFLFNLFYYGPYYHANIPEFDSRGSLSSSPSLSEGEIKKKKDERASLYSSLKRDYATFTSGKSHILPNPKDKNFVDIVESKESSTLEKLLKYDRKLGNKRKFTKNGVDDDITEARKFFKDYVKKLTDLDKLDKAIYDQNNEIDILEGRTKIGKEFLARVMNILDAYFESTEGLVRGNDTHSPNQLSQIAKFDEKFLVQMSSIGNECEISYFKK
jgi:hypothetical protein